MSRYRKFEPSLYGEGWFRGLSGPAPNAQDLWIYLNNGPHTTILPGLFEAGLAAIAERLRWPFPDTERCFQEILETNRLEFDADALVMWIPGGIAANLPVNQNVIKSWRRTWGEIPGTLLKYNFLEEMKGVVKSQVCDKMLPYFFEYFPELGSGEFQGLPKPLAKPLREPLSQGFLKPGTGTGTGTGEEKEKRKKKKKNFAETRGVSFDEFLEG